MEKYEVYYDITLIGFLWVNEDYKYRYEPFYEGVERVKDHACLLKVMENGKETTLRTIGDKWSYLQRTKFGANAQPFYVLIDNEGKPLNKAYKYDEDINQYVDFLQTGLKNYKK